MEWILALIAGVLGVLAVLLKGRSEGRKQAEGKQAKEVLKRVEVAKKVKERVNGMSDDDIRERMRDKSE